MSFLVRIIDQSADQEDNVVEDIGPLPPSRTPTSSPAATCATAWSAAAPKA